MHLEQIVISSTLVLMLLLRKACSYSVISSGVATSCAVTSGGAVYCWGLNIDGEVGVGWFSESEPVSLPVVDMSSDVIAIVSGFFHSCVLKADGSLYCWGANNGFQLGDNTDMYGRATPDVPVGMSANVTLIAAGSYHTCAVKAGELYCWGFNDFGQLGQGTQNSSTGGPLLVASMPNGVIAITAGEGHTCALLSGGALYCWGNNDYGQVGIDDFWWSLPPEPVHLSSDVTDVSAGYFHTCAIVSLAASLYCWGDNAFGQIGIDTWDWIRPLPSAVPGMSSGVISIALGRHHTCAVKQGGTMYCWGDNGSGQLGDETQDLQRAPVPVIGLTSPVLAISCGEWFTCAITIENGTVYCWGDNYFGQLGYGTRGWSFSPVEVPNLQVFLRSPSPSSQPSSLPSGQPSRQPFVYPTSQPSGRPSRHPSQQPMVSPSAQPSSQPSLQPSGQSSGQPSQQPTTLPSRQPSVQPSYQPSSQPFSQPTCQPSVQPTIQPSRQPSRQPFGEPSMQPTIQPSLQPVGNPSGQPSRQPTFQPSVCPSNQPTSQPSWQPSYQPSLQPTGQPSTQPFSQPSRQPTMRPSSQPVSKPSVLPIALPSGLPSLQPNAVLTLQTSSQPASTPTIQPPEQPSFQPNCRPSYQPTIQPTGQPLSRPSSYPSRRPSIRPSRQPVGTPTIEPSRQPTQQPTGQPTGQPLCNPSTQSTKQPFTQPYSHPSSYLSLQPSMQPFLYPSVHPSFRPTSLPSCLPTHHSSKCLTSQPSTEISSIPSNLPTRRPSRNPTNQSPALPSLLPLLQPTGRPSGSPTSRPTSSPSQVPSSQSLAVPSNGQFFTPTKQPIRQLVKQPSSAPSSQPLPIPIVHPTPQPFCMPSRYPFSQQSPMAPSSQPSRQPSRRPTAQPSSQPGTKPSCVPSCRPSSCPSSQPSQHPSIRPKANVLPIVVDVNSFSNGTIALHLAQQTVANVEQLLLAASTSLLSSLERISNTNGSASVQTISFVSEFVKTSLSVISLPKPSKSNSTNSTGTPSSVTLRLVIPSSSNSLSLDISSDMGGGNGVGAMVSVIQLSAALVLLSGSRSMGNGSENHEGNKNNKNALEPISVPVIASDVLSIALTAVSSDLSVSNPILPTFEASLALSESSSPQIETTQLHHNCSIGAIETVSVLCRSSHVWLNMSCTGKASAVVKRSCPVYKHVCTVLNLADNSIASTGYCQTITAAAGSVICRCGYEGAANSNNSAALASLNGKVSVAALGTFASGRLDASLVVAKPIAGDVATESVIVFLAFGSLWIVGASCMLVSYWNFSTSLSYPSNVRSSGKNAMKGDFATRYLSMIVPPSLQVDRWWLTRMWELLCTKHIWFRVSIRLLGFRSHDFANESLDRQQRREMLDIVYVVTSLTMSCFIMATFYDLQSPVDDGYCGKWRDEESCLFTKTALDPHVNKCSWAEVASEPLAATVSQSSAISGAVISVLDITAEASGSGGRKPCRLNTITLSPRAYLLAFLITSWGSIVVMFVLDRIFVILHSYSLSVSSSSNLSVVTPVALGDAKCPPLLDIVPISHKKVHKLDMEILVPRLVAISRNAWGQSQKLSPINAGGIIISELELQSQNHVVAGVVALQVLILDLMGHDPSTSKYDLHVLHHVFRDWFPEKRFLSSVYWQYAMWMLLLLMHAGAMYFLLAKAAIRGYSWQVTFFRVSVSEVLMDVFFIEILEVLLLDYLLVVMIFGSRMKLVQKQLSCTQLIDLEPERKGGGIKNYQEVMSKELASVTNQYPSLPECKLAVALCRKHAKDERNIRCQSRGGSWSRRALLWCLYWFPNEVVGALVTMTAASLATFILYLYLFVLLPIMPGVIAWLVLLLPMLGVFGVWVVRDVWRRKHIVAQSTVAVLEGNSPSTSNQVPESHGMDWRGDLESLQWPDCDEKLAQMDEGESEKEKESDTEGSHSFHSLDMSSREVTSLDDMVSVCSGDSSEIGESSDDTSDSFDKYYSHPSANSSCFSTPSSMSSDIASFEYQTA